MLISKPVIYKILSLFVFVAYGASTVTNLHAQCETASVSLPDASQPVINPSISYCVSFTIDPSVTGHPIGVCLDLQHTWQGDLSIRVLACGNTLMLMTRPGNPPGSCSSGSPFGSSAGVNGTFCFSNTGPDPDNILPAGGGNFGLSPDRCNANTVDSFEELGIGCGDDPYTFSICITDHALGNTGMATNITPVFLNSPSCGCTDPAASNYDPAATVDDGSCMYLPCIIDLNSSTTPEVCGQSNGSVNLSISGGSGSYNINWSNSSTASQQTGLSAGTYSVTVTDANNATCSAVTSVSISDVNLLNISSTIIQPTCGEDNGSAEIIIVDGVGPFEYFWSPPLSGTSNQQTNLGQGTYFVTVLDQSTGCEQIMPIGINDSQPMTLDADITNTTCGNENGAIELTVNNSSGNLTYTWDNAIANGPNPTDLPSGTYQVTVADNTLNCEIIAEFEIVDSEAFTIDANVMGPSCGLQNGSITVIPTGGSGSFQYSWTGINPGNVPSAGDLSPGTYNIEVTDTQDGCTQIVEITLAPSDPLVVQETSSHPLCGNTNGTIEISVSNGSGNYNYNWSNGLPPNSLQTNLGAGNYSVTVTDLGGDMCTAEIQILLEDGGEITVSSEVTPTSCGNDNGSVTLDVIGGSGSYTIGWSDGIALPNLVRNNLPPGTYTIIVTDNSSGCTDMVNVVIDESSPLVIFGDIQPTTCGLNNGQIDLVILNGSGNYAIQWNDPTLFGTTVGDLSPGTYEVIIFDNVLGCTETASFEIQASEPLLMSHSIQHTTCGLDNGAIELTILQGVGPFYYDWNGLAPNTSATAMNLAAGFYTVSVTDGSSDCTIALNFEIDFSDELVFSSNVTDASCGNPNGAIDIISHNSQDNFTYIWSNGMSGPSIANVTAGSYEVTITDPQDEFCTAFLSIEVEELGNISATSGTTPTRCGNDNGSVQLFVENGTGPFAVSWNGGPPINDLFVDNLSPGNYLFQIEDQATGCMTTLEVFIESSQPLATQINTVHTTCNEDNGSMVITVFNGSGDFTFQWSGGILYGNEIYDLGAGDYFVTITDNQLGCIIEEVINIQSSEDLIVGVESVDTRCGDPNGSIELTVLQGTGPFVYDWQTSAIGNTPIAADLAAGLYSVIVTDQNTGCTENLQIDIQSSTPLTGSITSTNNTCNLNNGIIEISALSGLGNYSYEWASFPGYNQPVKSDLTQGTYFITVTDLDTDCQVVFSETVFPGENLEADIQISPTTCGENNGSIHIIMQNATGDYSFAWGDANLSGNQLSDLQPGTYSVTITDESDGCTIDHSIFVGSSNALTSTFENTNTSCGLENGSIIIDVTNGSGEFTFDWSHDSSLTDSNASNLTGDQTYNITITDNVDQCILIESIFIETSSSLSLTIETEPLQCGPNDASIAVMVSDGSGNYEFTWQDFPDEETGFLNSLTAGDYALSIHDLETGCTADTSITIASIQTLSIQCQTIQHETEFGLQDGIVQFDIINGTAPFHIIITDPVGVVSIDTSDRNISWINIAPGNNTIQITDANGCQSNCTFIVNQGPCGLEASISSFEHPSCADVDNGSITIQSNQTDGITYTWEGPTPIGNTNIADNLAPGDYTISISDETSCTVILQITLVEPPPLLLECNILQHESARGASDGVIQTNFSGGTAPFQYFLVMGLDTLAIGNLQAADVLDFTSLNPGTYSFSLIDALECSISCSLTIEAGPCTLVITAQSTDPTCNQSTDGGIEVNILDAVGSYQVTWPVLNAEAVVSTLQASMVSAGDYLIIVEDSAGCLDSIEVSLLDPLPISLTCMVTHETAISAGDGSLSIDLSNFTPPFIASLNTTPAQTVETSDPSEVLFTDLVPGLYSITIEDATGCIATCQRNINPANCDFSIQLLQKQDLSCYESADGIIALGISDATGEVRFDWPDLTNQIGLSRRENLPAGIYLITARDERGCSAEMEVLLDQPRPLDATMSATHPTCGEPNGSISVMVTGGTPNYEFQWNDGVYQPIRNNCSDGTYAVTITDANNCITEMSTSLNMEEGPKISMTIIDGNDCFGDQNGHITVDVETNGTPYEINWSTGDSGVHNLNNLFSGNYQVTVIDENQCEAVLDFVIEEPDLLVVETNLIQPSCMDALGRIELIPSGGVGPYRISGVTEPAMEFIFEEIGAGFYTFTVTDQYGCMTVVEVTMTAGEPPFCDAGFDHIMTCRQPSAILNAAIQEPTNLTYYWVHLPSSDTVAINQLKIEVTRSGSYEFMVINDMTQCTARDTTQVIDEIEEIDFVDLTFQAPLCPGDQNGFIQVNEIEGGTAPFEILVNGQTQGVYVPNLSAGSYKLDIIDQHGCTWPPIDITLENPLPLWIELPDVYFGIEGDTVTITPVIQPSAGRISKINWYIDDTLFCADCRDVSLDIIAENGAHYRIEIEDENGCIYTAETQLLVRRTNHIYIPDAFSPNNDGTNDYFFPHGDQNLSLIKEMVIYDRWGNRLFEKKDLQPSQIDQGWDGTARGRSVLPGTYIYYIIVVFENGHEQKFYGELSLLR